MTTVECSICVLQKVPVELCHRCNQSDKQVCQECAVKMFAACSSPTCNCFGFVCAFCRDCNKSTRPWMETSALYWKRRCEMAECKLELCAEQIDRFEQGVIE